MRQAEQRQRAGQLSDSMFHVPDRSNLDTAEKWSEVADRCWWVMVKDSTFLAACFVLEVEIDLT